MSIYREFEEFVRKHGRKITETESLTGLKEIYAVKWYIVALDPSDSEDGRIVSVLNTISKRMEYLSPYAVKGMKFISNLIGEDVEIDENASDPKRLEEILDILKNYEICFVCNKISRPHSSIKVKDITLHFCSEMCRKVFIFAYRSIPAALSGRSFEELDKMLDKDGFDQSDRVKIPLIILSDPNLLQDLVVKVLTLLGEPGLKLASMFDNSEDKPYAE